MQVRQGTAPHLFEVESETDPETWYQVFANGTVIITTAPTQRVRTRPTRAIQV